MLSRRSSLRALTFLTLLLVGAPFANAHGSVAADVAGTGSSSILDPFGTDSVESAPAGITPGSAPGAMTPIAALTATAATGSVPPATAADDAISALGNVLVPFETANRVFPVSGTPWKTVMGADTHDIEFQCPPADAGTAINDNANTFTIRAGCPFRIIDDADLLGSAQIAVSPVDPNHVAFFSLHGAGTTEGPTPRSRDPSPEGTAVVTGLSHTTFTTTDTGRSWFDNPWGQEGFGEHVSGIMDRHGNMYIAALWSKPIADGEFDYLFKLYKADTVETDVAANYQYDEFVQNRAPGNQITEVNLVYLPVPEPEVPAENSTVGNVTKPADPSEVGNSTTDDEAAAKGDRVMAVWHERALDYRNSTTGKSSWIDAAWTDTRTHNNWSRLEDKELIGPCMAASNPVAFNGKAYVACTVDAGYNARARARIGQIDVWSIDPMTGKTELVDYTLIRGGNPRMAGRPDGYMAVAAVQMNSEDNIDIEVSYGWYGRYWTGGADMGSLIHSVTSGRPALEARITAMALIEDKNTLYVSYMERSNTSAPPEPNPDRTPSAGELSEYRKVVLSTNECAPVPLSVVDLQVGASRHPFQEGVVNDATGVFDDLQDGMAVARLDDESELVYFAYGDHGVIQYGWILGGTGGLPCGVRQPPLLLGPAPLPAALGVTNPYSMFMGSAVGVTALAMVTYLLTAKRKTLNKLAVKDK